LLNTVTLVVNNDVIAHHGASLIAFRWNKLLVLLKVL